MVDSLFAVYALCSTAVHIVAAIQIQLLLKVTKHLEKRLTEVEEELGEGEV